MTQHQHQNISYNAEHVASLPVDQFVAENMHNYPNDPQAEQKLKEVHAACIDKVKEPAPAEKTTAVAKTKK